MGDTTYPRIFGRGGARNSTVMRGASFPKGGPIFLGKIAWGCQISWGAKFPVTGSRFPYISVKIDSYGVKYGRADVTN